MGCVFHLKISPLGFQPSYAYCFSYIAFTLVLECGIKDFWSLWSSIEDESFQGKLCGTSFSWVSYWLKIIGFLSFARIFEESGCGLNYLSPKPFDQEFGFWPLSRIKLNFHQELVSLINWWPKVSSMTIRFIIRLLKELHWMIVEFCPDQWKSQLLVKGCFWQVSWENWFSIDCMCTRTSSLGSCTFGWYYLMFSGLFLIVWLFEQNSTKVNGWPSGLLVKVEVKDHVSTSYGFWWKKFKGNVVLEANLFMK